MTIKDIIEKSGDTFIKEFNYIKGNVILILEFDELEMDIKLSFESNLIACNLPNSEDSAYRTCFLEVLDLKDVLEVKNGIFIAPKDFTLLMKDKRNNLNLAYGLRESQYSYIFSLSSSYKLASFIIKDLSSINITKLSME